MAIKQTETGIPYGPCAFNALKCRVLDQDIKNFPDGVFDRKLHNYLQKHISRVDYLYCNYDEDACWIQVEGLDEEQDRENLGIAGVVIHDDRKRLYWSYQNPKYQGDSSDVEAGGSWIPKWGICDDPEQLLMIVETFLTTGTAWEGCRWVITEGD